MWVIVIDDETVYNQVIVGPFEKYEVAKNYTEVADFRKDSYKIQGLYAPHAPSLKLATRNSK